MKAFPFTKVVATLGPSSSSPVRLRSLLKAGMDGVRLNFSHLSYGDSRALIETVRRLSQELNIPLPIMQDLRGPKLRVGLLPSPLKLTRQQDVVILCDPEGEVPPCPVQIPSDFSDLPIYTKSGDRLLLDDGKIELKVTGRERGWVRARVVVGGTLLSNKGINLPNTVITSLPPITEKDREDLRFGAENGVDQIALSFVQSAQDVLLLRRELASLGSKAAVFAKIEKPLAVKNLEAILPVTDGIIIARGDLGVETRAEELFLLQKGILQRAHRMGKSVVLATQLLESMMALPTPTRAEVSDISAAILDGVDILLLSGETAVGPYPAQAVQTLKKVASQVERSPYVQPSPGVSVTREREIMNSVVHSAVVAAESLKARWIVVFSLSGATALLLSKYRPPCPLMAFSPDPLVLNNMALYRGTFPHPLAFDADTDSLVERAVEILRQEKRVSTGDRIVVVGGVIPAIGATNLMRIIVI